MKSGEPFTNDVSSEGKAFISAVCCGFVHMLSLVSASVNLPCPWYSSLAIFEGTRWRCDASWYSCEYIQRWEVAWNRYCQGGQISKKLADVVCEWPLARPPSPLQPLEQTAAGQPQFVKYWWDGEREREQGISCSWKLATCNMQS